MQDREQAAPVRRRQVFYIPGYDPFPPRRYRELYRREAQAQAETSGYRIGIAPLPKADRTGWQVRAGIDGQEITSDIHVLVWSDLVRDSMSGTIPATYLQLLRTGWTYIATGALRRLMWMRKGPVIAALYPVGMLLAQLAIAVALAGWLSAQVARLAATLAGQSALQPLADPLGWAVFLAAAWGILRWFKAQDRRLFAYYLMHDFAYAARHGGAYGAELEQRIGGFADRIATALRGEVDEVLVVGHSSGAYLGVSVLADLIRAGQVHDGGPALSFLSLGQVVPMVSFLPRAQRLRGDLAFLAARDELAWVDVSAPGDGCAFALCDPVAVSGVAPPDKRWPLVISAAFTQTLSPARWKALRWRFFRLHFQYLCAFDRPGDYDYFRITAGPLTLGDRFAGRKPSGSRIDVPASKYSDIAS